MGKMVNYHSVPLLLTLDDFAIPPADTRAFWATKEACPYACPYACAEAYLTKTIGHKIIGNVYMKFNKPGRPTKIFTDKDEAIKWLKTFL